MADTGPEFIIVVDTREQKPWRFRQTLRCKGIESEALPTGDYTIRGMEREFVIERKATPAELAKNITEARWEAELQRLSSIPHSFVLCEFTMRQLLAYPAGSRVPRGKVRIRGSFLLRRVNEYMMRYRVPFIFAGEEAQEEALSLLKRAAEWRDTPKSG